MSGPTVDTTKGGSKTVSCARDFHLVTLHGTVWAQCARGLVSNPFLASKHGFGTYANENSGTYSGDWANGRPHGEGVFVAKDNQWNYTGGYAKGMMEGQGKYTFRRCRWSMSDRETYCANKNRYATHSPPRSLSGRMSRAAVDTIARQSPIHSVPFVADIVAECNARGRLYTGLCCTVVLPSTRAVYLSVLA
eukprot:SAG31_NODE_2516_length_5580_cov_5.787448_4_plen_192_part_00